MLIKKISAKKIKDSRGEFTIEVSVNGQKASSPSGKSTGKYETPCWHDSLDWNINAINNLSLNFEIKSFQDLRKVEEQVKLQYHLKDAKFFGANALFALESAILKAIAKDSKKELWQVINPKAKLLPRPLGNAIGGGLHSHSENHPTFQEFLIVPKGKSVNENVKIIKEVHKKLKSILKANKVNDEGAWETSTTEEETLEILSTFKDKIEIGVDVASSSFYNNLFYSYPEKNISKKEQIILINSLINKFDLYYCEDPLEEEDFEGFSKICPSRNTKTLITGDDLTATHKDRLERAIENKSINAIIIKPNQNGSLIELAEIFEICKKNKIKTILSHRSGETLDDAIADYAFAFGADLIKCGISTKWREAKLNRLIEIQKSLK